VLVHGRLPLEVQLRAACDARSRQLSGIADITSG